MLLERQIVDVDTFVEMARASDALMELVEGEVIEMSRPGILHGIITMNAARPLSNFVHENNLGFVTAAETGFILDRDPDTVRGLDVAFVRSDRLRDGIPSAPVPMAPDLAVEVISPGNSASDIHRKILQLLHAGTRLIWIIYPDTQTVDVHTPDGAKTLTIDSTLDGGDVLPGFSLPVRALFP